MNITAGSTMPDTRLPLETVIVSVYMLLQFVSIRIFVTTSIWQTHPIPQHVLPLTAMSDCAVV